MTEELILERLREIERVCQISQMTRACDLIDSLIGHIESDGIWSTSTTLGEIRKPKS